MKKKSINQILVATIIFLMVIASGITDEKKANETDDIDKIYKTYTMNFKEQKHLGNILLLEKYIKNKKDKHLSFAAFVLVREYYFAKKYEKAAALEQELLSICSLESLGIIEENMVKSLLIKLLLYGIDAHRKIGMNKKARLQEIQLKQIILRVWGISFWERMKKTNTWYFNMEQKSTDKLRDIKEIKF